MAPVFGFCNVAVMPVRTEPSHRAEQSTQLLYGEKVIIFEVNPKEWARIRCVHDNYEGWCRFSQVTDLTSKEYKKPTKNLSPNHTGKILIDDGEMAIPMGSELIAIKGGLLRAAATTGTYKGKKLAVADIKPTADIVKNTALQYLHAPYLWGGRSISGLDCSGFTQMTYKLCNLQLPRDASQQAQKGVLVDFLEMAQCGDLAFFADKDGKIDHVGVLLDNQTIIHATEVAGRVVIDRIDMGGIISISLKRRTHNLRFVKRFLP